MNTLLIKSVAVRFLKAFIAGAATSVGVTTVQNAHSWADLGTALANLGLALVIGGVTGLILAFEKFATWTE